MNIDYSRTNTDEEEPPIPIVIPSHLDNPGTEYNKERTVLNVPAEPEVVDDPWDAGIKDETSPERSESTTAGHLCHVLVIVSKLGGLVALLFIFICSLDLLSSAFRVLGGKTAGKVFTSNELLQNPIAGLMIGILATVLVQSSSTSTSIVVTMVASGILDVRPAIPIMMGANIGTSVTNTIVSLAQSSDRGEFRRAFAGATVHDMFNWLSVLAFLPLEIATGFLYHLTEHVVLSFNLDEVHSSKADFLKKLTKPVTSRVIQLDKKVIEGIAVGNADLMEKSLIKEWCGWKSIIVEANLTITRNMSSGTNSSVYQVSELRNITLKEPLERCWFIFQDTGLDDLWVGLILLVLSLFLLCTCLVIMVKVLHSLLRGQIAKVIHRTINADFPGCFKHLTGYVAILIGAGMTILVQSSSVFTSAMTPLVGIGVIKLERMYPLTLGSNVGTTATGMLAAMAASGDKLEAALQIGFCHLFFNVSGIVLFYPIPQMRLPIKLAKIMGNTTARYRWFAIFYLIIMFFVVPALVFLLSLLGLVIMSSIVGFILVILIAIITINILQQKHPDVLPERLQNWEFLPECLHSLDPVDRLIGKLQTFIKYIVPCKCCSPKSNSLQIHSRSTLPSLVSHAKFASLVESKSRTESAVSSIDSTPAISRSTSLLIHPSISTKIS